MSVRRSALCAALAACLAIPALPASADVVHLRGGRRLVGRVEDTPAGVRVTIDGGVLVVPREQVDRIERAELPRDEFARRIDGLAADDVAGALAAAREAELAGLPDVSGRALEKAAAHAPQDPVVRAALARWTALVRRIPDDAEGDAKLLADFGPGARLHVSAHFRIAHDVAPEDARRRGEALEAAYGKVHELVAKLGLDAKPLARRLDVMLFADHARWAGRVGLPEASLRGLSGIYLPGPDRVFLFDVATMPEAVAAREAVEKSRGELAAYEKGLEDLRRRAVAVGRELATEGGMVDPKRRRETEEDLATTRAALAGERSKAEDARVRLAATERDLDVESERATLASTTHEACHQISFATGVCRPGQPTWLLEGLATLFEVTSRTTFVVEAPNELRLDTLRRLWSDGGGGRLEDVLTDAIFLRPNADRAAAYAEAWSFAYFLARKRPAELAAFLRDGRPLAPLAASAAARLDEARRFFGDLGELERAWKDDVRLLPSR